MKIWDNINILLPQLQTTITRFRFEALIFNWLTVMLRWRVQTNRCSSQLALAIITWILNYVFTRNQLDTTRIQEQNIQKVGSFCRQKTLWININDVFQVQWKNSHAEGTLAAFQWKSHWMILCFLKYFHEIEALLNSDNRNKYKCRLGSYFQI